MLTLRSLPLAIAICFMAAATFAQKQAPQTNMPKTPYFNVEKASAMAIPCEDCSQQVPNEIMTSDKNAVTIYGPPDGVGKPVEYQVYSRQKADSRWTLRAAGKVEKAGDRVTHKYYRPGQLMVLLYCKTPFQGMATFSNIRVAAPVSTEPCTECACERCENQTPTGVFTSDLKTVDISRSNGDEAHPLEYFVFTQAKDKKWTPAKASTIKGQKGAITACYNNSIQTLVLVYDKNIERIGVKFTPTPCDK
ncbi:MAG: hypothetical protein R3A50_11825 [Saprospiraceae bacterium]